MSAGTKPSEAMVVVVDDLVLAIQTEAAHAERTRIVAFLRWEAARCPSPGNHWWFDAADRIERGEDVP